MRSSEHPPARLAIRCTGHCLAAHASHACYGVLEASLVRIFAGGCPPHLRLIRLARGRSHLRVTRIRAGIDEAPERKCAVPRRAHLRGRRAHACTCPANAESPAQVLPLPCRWFRSAKPGPPLTCPVPIPAWHPMRFLLPRSTARGHEDERQALESQPITLGLGLVAADITKPRHRPDMSGSSSSASSREEVLRYMSGLGS